MEAAFERWEARLKEKTAIETARIGAAATVAAARINAAARPKAA
jgi:hypothetical protein